MSRAYKETFSPMHCSEHFANVVVSLKTIKKESDHAIAMASASVVSNEVVTLYVSADSVAF